MTNDDRQPQPPSQQAACECRKKDVGEIAEERGIGCHQACRLLCRR